MKIPMGIAMPKVAIISGRPIAHMISIDCHRNDTFGGKGNVIDEVSKCTRGL
jgi:hypothetical protein